MKLFNDKASRLNWKIVLAVVLAILAGALYYARWVLYKSSTFHSEMTRFFIGDLAFLFLQVLFVTVFLETYLKWREKQAMRQKLNMIIGAFFSETGFELLREIVFVDRAADEIQEIASPQLSWTEKDFNRARSSFSNHQPNIQPSPEALESMSFLLTEKKDSILSLLTNQALLDHETFTDLLWSISHLADELAARKDFSQLPTSDIKHLGIDMARAYEILGIEWLNYLEHLQKQYPYLYSLAVRNNPLNPYCVVEIKETGPTAQ